MNKLSFYTYKLFCVKISLQQPTTLFICAYRYHSFEIIFKFLNGVKV